MADNLSLKLTPRVRKAAKKLLSELDRADAFEKKFAGSAPIGFDTATTIRSKARAEFKKLFPGSSKRLRDDILLEIKRSRGDFKDGARRVLSTPRKK